MRILGRLRGLLFRGRVRVRGEDDPPPGYRRPLVDVFSLLILTTVNKVFTTYWTPLSPILSVHIMITTIFSFSFVRYNPLFGYDYSLLLVWRAWRVYLGEGYSEPLFLRWLWTSLIARCQILRQGTLMQN